MTKAIFTTIAALWESKTGNENYPYSGRASSAVDIIIPRGASITLQKVSDERRNKIGRNEKGDFKAPYFEIMVTHDPDGKVPF